MPQLENAPTKKLNIWLPLLFSLMLIIGMFVGAKLKQSPQVIIKPLQDTDLQQYNRLGQGRIEDLIRFIEAKYVDKVDSEELIEEAINNILTQLDPHSNYITASQLKRVNEDLEGNFDGIGIEFIIIEDTIVVVAPVKGGPSEKAGILAGDKIVEIEDTLVSGVEMDVRNQVNKLRGEKGTEVKVGVLRNNDSNIKRFTIVRDEIPNHSVDVGYMLDDKTGYIKINRFSATTYKEFIDKLDKLVVDQGMTDLIIDLRQNPGGYLQEATKILSQFFKERGRLLVYTEGRTVRRNEYETSGQALFDIGEIAILIDEGSASASEIVAGAAQDWDRGVIVGRRSFGKGLVQEQYELKDGSALRLTVARYYTPSERLIQKSYSDKSAYEKDVFNRFEAGELINKDSIIVADTTQYFTLLENRVVYGGGGITPDVFVPIDTSLMEDYFLDLRQKMPQFTYRYVQNNKALFDGMNLERFRNNFEIDQNILIDLEKYAAENGVKIQPDKMKASQKNIKLMLKAEIARRLFQVEGFYTIWNDADEVVKAARKALQSESPLTYGN